MARFALSGSRLHRTGLLALSGALCLGLAGLAVVLLERQRITPDLSRIAGQIAQLEQSRQRLEALPPVRPIHWQMRHLRQLARVLPGLEDVAALQTDPARAPQAVRQRIGDFGGTVWKLALQGPLSSVVQLCRVAQPHMPLIVAEIQATAEMAHAVLFVLGTDPEVRSEP